MSDQTSPAVPPPSPRLPSGPALVVGASGGIGAALVRALEEDGRFSPVIAASRSGSPPLDVTDEASVAAFAASLGDTQLALVVDATGLLHDAEMTPERSWRDIDPAVMARSFAINAIGPALLLKHLAPRLARDGKATFATLSAKVGSIGDNRLGGWYAYRASKAALNQIVRTASVELARRRPGALCVAIHPGTVDTRLTKPFAKAGLAVATPDEAASRLLAVLDGLPSSATGGFYDYRGEALPW
ncbi:SDR family NAD(P)-dependent oxidoreductase [Salinarimonas ramus]|uniref:SDR family oxidoreductase n=1 Tax=Salinarimonas ramus TaxID=690164 RepID=A0A917QFL1_9HYPH|nr:SDR family NAD(P)-dependent oxidoreductase [Salinarimonas ramus]GGK48089.1 SDR family oxidoreductase [Salinarimonas ramus]